uniref:Flagellar protein FliL n=1 Tax=Thermodesulfobacterium geofontis TaxID=1295609 RepID=A0A7V4JR62_9BACT
MEEDIKKELKEIKKEVEAKEPPSEIEPKKEKPEEKIDITPEKAEGLIEKLIKPEEEKEEVPEEKPKKIKSKDAFLILGSAFVVIFIILGIWMSLKLIKGDFKKEKNLKPLSESNILIPEGEAVKKFSKIVISKEEKEVEYPYKLELKNFLIPLGLKEFLSLNVTLYFDNSTSVKELADAEINFREKLYSYLKNVSPDIWKDTKEVEVLEEKIKKELEKENIKPLPQRIILEGVILKG